MLLKLGGWGVESECDAILFIIIYFFLFFFYFGDESAARLRLGIERQGAVGRTERFQNQIASIGRLDGNAASHRYLRRIQIPLHRHSIRKGTPFPYPKKKKYINKKKSIKKILNYKILNLKYLNFKKYKKFEKQIWKTNFKKM